MAITLKPLGLDRAKKKKKKKKKKKSENLKMAITL